jgi:hypothetical protein
VGEAGRIDNAHSAEAGPLMADLAARGSIASPLREHDLAEDMIAQYQAGAQQRVGG